MCTPSTRRSPWRSGSTRETSGPNSRGAGRTRRRERTGDGAVNRPFYELGSVVGSAVTALTSAASSVCCIGPLAITLLGLNGVILAAAFQPYPWSILPPSLLLLVPPTPGAY